MSVGEMRQGYALVIGVNSYNNGISKLKTAVADETAIADLLAGEHEYNVARLLDRDASLKDIQDSLLNYAEILDEDSAFLFYFAGHGIARGDGNQGPQGFLLPHDAQPTDVETWVSMEWLRSTLDKLPCQHLLVILDCCFACSFRWSSTRSVQWDGQPLYDSQFERYLKGSAWQALTSASADEKAMDISPGARNTRGDGITQKHSPFAAAMLKGLGGAADSSRGDHEPDGVITATELFQYTFEELVPSGAPSLQTPGIWPLKPDNQGQFIFRNPLHSRKTIPDPPLNDDNNPWQGLKAYTSKQQRLFFGREDAVNALLERLQTRPGLIAVLGASGTGKSSVIKAGLIPALQVISHANSETDDNWGIIEMARLGAHPNVQLHNAVEALNKLPANQPRMLFIDQFEELYTHSHNEEDKKHFLVYLRQLINDDYTSVVLTLRSDFEPHPASSSELGDLWDRGKARYVLPAFTMEEYRSCIEGPANEMAVYFEPNTIVDELLGEVAANPGALPMLSFALAEMYRNAQKRRRKSGTNDRALNDEDYDSIGGMIGAMHSRATLLYEDVDAAHRRVIERIFLRMLSIDGGRVSRRRVSTQELECEDPNEQVRVQYVLEQYIDARLLVADGSIVEPAHDTLISAWGLLLNWRQNAQSQTLIRAIWQDALAWWTNERENALLWDDHPRRLAEAESRAQELNKLETQFIRAGRKSLRYKRFKQAVLTFIIMVMIFFLYEWQQEANYRTDEQEDAEIARDKLFLNFYSRLPLIFSASTLLGNNSGNILEFTGVDEENYWHPLIGDTSGVFAMGITMPIISGDDSPYILDKKSYKWGRGRILAIGHDEVLSLVDTSAFASRFIEHSLSWLETDPNSPIYISVGHQEQLAGLPKHPLEGQEREEGYNDAALGQATTTCGEDKYWDWDIDKDWIFGWPGIQRSLGPDDPLFAGSALHKKLWEWGYCEIYAISDLTLLDTAYDPDVAQGVLIVANPFQMDHKQQKSLREWVIDSDNGLLIAGSGENWADAHSGDYSSYPINKIMRIFNLQWKGQEVKD